MKIESVNAEGYQDPTACIALNKVATEEAKAAFMPLVYVCSPLRGEVECNVQRAQWYSRQAVKLGYIPITPHIYFTQFMNDESPAERDKALFMNKVLLGKCHELWVVGETISEGMQLEIKWARWRRMPIRYFSEDMEEKV